MSSLYAVRQHLHECATGLRPDDADGSVAVAAAELQQRAARLAQAGFEVRVSDAVAQLLPSAITHQEGWG